MKIVLLLFLARYYSKITSRDVNHVKTMFVPLLAIFVPVALIATQPDLGTSVLVAFGGIALIWLAGFRLKYFVIGFILSLCVLPVAISFLKAYQKSEDFNFFKSRARSSRCWISNYTVQNCSWVWRNFW